jgi:uncharacterized membrane protein
MSIPFSFWRGGVRGTLIGALGSYMWVIFAGEPLWVALALLTLAMFAAAVEGELQRYANPAQQVLAEVESLTWLLTIRFMEAEAA